MGGVLGKSSQVENEKELLNADEIRDEPTVVRETKFYVVPEDMVKGLFGDLLYNMHRDFLLGLLIFAFVVSFLLLWIIAVDIFDINGTNKYTASFQKEPPASATTGVPMPGFSVVVTDKNLAKISGAEVNILAFPSEAFSLNITLPTGIPIHTRDSNCLTHMYGDATMHNPMDSVLCTTPTHGGKATTNGDGVAHFSEFSINGGPAVMYSLIFSVEMPSSLIETGDTVVGSFLEWQVSVRSPVREVTVPTPMPDSVVVGTLVPVVIKTVLEFSGNASVAINATNLLQPVVLSASITGRHYPIKSLQPLAAIREHALTVFSITSRNITIDSVTVASVTTVTATIRMHVVADWAVGSLMYPAVYYCGEYMFIGPVLGNEVMRPILYRPVTVAAGITSVIVESELDTNITEGELSKEIKIRLVGGTEHARVLVVASKFNGMQFPPFWHTEGTTEVQRYKHLIKPYSSSCESVVGEGTNYTCTIAIRFSENGLPGRYGVEFHAGDAVSAVWEVNVLSSVLLVTPSFAEAPWSGNGRTFTVGVPWDNTPSFYVSNAAGAPVSGKAVVVSASSDIGISYESHASGSSGTISFANLVFTYAKRSGVYNLSFTVDKKVAFVVPVTVQYGSAASLVRCTHVEVVGAVPSSITRGDTTAGITVMALNAFGVALPNVDLWAQLGHDTGIYPPVNFASGNLTTDYWPGASRYSPVQTTGLSGTAVIPLNFDVALSAPLTLYMSCGSTMHPSEGVTVGLESVLPSVEPTMTAESANAWRFSTPANISSFAVVAVQHPRKLSDVFYSVPPSSNIGTQPVIQVDAKNTPGVYVFAVWNYGQWSTMFTVTAVSEVAELRVQRISSSVEEVVSPGSSTKQGVPFAIQPQVLVLDSAGNPVSGVRVVAVIGHPEVSTNAFYVPSALYFGCLALMLSSGPERPISEVSDANGVANFNSLGIVGGTSPLTVTYVFLNINEGGTNGIYVHEALPRNLTDVTNVHLTSQPSPVATPGGRLRLPPVATVLNNANVPYVFAIGTLDVIPFNASSTLRGFISSKGDIHAGLGALSFTNTVFLPSSDIGQYRLRVITPGSVGDTTSIMLTRDPHVLQLEVAPPTRIMVGTPFKVVLNARLADGTGVPGVVIRSSLINRDYGTKCYGSSCGVVHAASLIGTTDVFGMAEFHIVVMEAMAGKYRLEFTARRGVDSILGAATSLKETSMLYGGSRLPSGMLDAQPPQFQSYLATRVKASVKSLASSLLTRAIHAAKTIVTKTPDFQVFNEVMLVNITTQPVLDPSSSEYTSKFGSDYGVFDVQPVITILGVNGGPLVGKSVTVSVLPIAAKVVVDWDKTKRTDVNGTYTFSGLRLNDTLPGPYQLVFHCDGEQSEISAEVYLLSHLEIIDFGSMYVRILIIVLILLPWLMANLPGSSVAWTRLAFALSGLMPLIVITIIPGVFDSTQLFVQLTLYLTSALWGGVTLLLVRLAYNQVMKSYFDEDVKVVNTYRYVRWLGKMIPFSSEEEIHEYREQLTLSSLGIFRRFALFLYNQYLGVFYGCSVPLTGTKHQYTWEITSGVTLHHSPNAYHVPMDAFKWQLGAFGSSNEEEKSKVCMQITGVSHYSKLTCHADGFRMVVTEFTGAEIDGLYFANDTSMINTCVACFVMAGSRDAVASLISEKLAGKTFLETYGIGRMKYIEDGRIRRDNTAGWTWKDSLKVKLHFAVAPIIVELESFRTTAFGTEAGRQNVGDKEEEIDETDDEADDDAMKVGRVWVQHRIPDEIRMSSGEPFPVFWSPNYDADTNLVLKENAPQDLNRVALDSTKPEHGGLPEDIVEPVYLPFRFLVCSSICVVVIVVMAFLTWWLYNLFVIYLTKLQNKIPKPPEMTPQEEEQINTDLQDGLTTAIETLAETDNKFYFLTAFIPTIESIDFISIWKWWYNVAHDMIKTAKTSGVIATVTGSLAMAANWVMLILNTPKILKGLRRNVPINSKVPKKAQCVVADRYVGMQAMHLVFAYALIFVITWIVCVLLLTPGFVKHVYNTYGTVIITAVVTSLGAVILENYVKFNWTAGSRVTKPIKYSRWQLFALALHAISGAVSTIVRWVKAIVAQTLLFARLDLDLFPSALNFLDIGYWSYHSMIYVDEVHNNPILRTFVGILLTDRTVRVEQRKLNTVPLTSYVKLTPTRVRAAGECEVKEVVLYTDSDVRYPSGEPLVLLKNEGKVPLKYYRSPFPVEGPRKQGEGCYMCGSSRVNEYYSCEPSQDEGYLFVRVVCIEVKDGKEVCSDHEGFEATYSRQVNEAACRVNGTVSTRLSERAFVSSYKLFGDDLPKKWRLLGSLDAEVWITIHEEESKAEGDDTWHTVNSDLRSCLAVCTVCYKNKAVKEGEKRCLRKVAVKPVASMLFSFQRPLILEIDGPPVRLRGYSVVTNNSSMNTDPLSWTLATAASTSSTWAVSHHVREAPMPHTREASTPVFPCWLVPSTIANLSFMEKLSRKEVLLPAIKQMMIVRSKHLSGYEGKSLLTGDLNEARGDSVFASNVERAAYRSMICRKGKWSLAFMLVMNPSMIKERKNARELGADNTAAKTVSFESAAVVLREGINPRWREGEVVQGAPGRRKSRFKPRLRSNHTINLHKETNTHTATLTVSCKACQVFDGVYRRREQVTNLIVTEDTPVSIEPGTVATLLKAYVGVTDVTKEVKGLLQGGGGRLALSRKSEKGCIDLAKKSTGFNIATGEAVTHSLTVVYTTAVWQCDDLASHSSGALPSVLCKVGGVWCISPPVPAPGFSYSYVTSSPSSSPAPSSSLKWCAWCAETQKWHYDTPIEISISSSTK